MKRQDGQHPQQGFWDLFTAFILSATVGMVLSNFLHIIRLHNASTASGGHQGSQHVRKEDLAMQVLMETRVCGSPAVDGYQRVNISCLLQSPTARWFRGYTAAGGRYEDMVVHIEQQADYDGLAVRWGINHKAPSPQDCAKACWSHRPGMIEGPYKDLPCNAFTYCNVDSCFEPDTHDHTRGDCWLKFTEGPAHPEVNSRGVPPERVLQRHPNAPARSQWTAGVLLPPGVQLRNGTFSPRYYW